MLKMEIRGFAIKFGTRKKKSRNLKIQALIKKLEYHEKIQSAEGITSIFHSNEKHIQLIQHSLSELMEESTNKAIIDCKSRWFDEGEKCTKYFLGLQSSKNKKKAIELLRNKNDQIIGDSQKIMDELQKFL